jgi:hypothetical protein
LTTVAQVVEFVDVNNVIGYQESDIVCGRWKLVQLAADNGVVSGIDRLNLVEDGEQVGMTTTATIDGEDRQGWFGDLNKLRAMVSDALKSNATQRATAGVLGSLAPSLNLPNKPILGAVAAKLASPDAKLQRAQLVCAASRARWRPCGKAIEAPACSLIQFFEFNVLQWATNGTALECCLACRAAVPGGVFTRDRNPVFDGGVAGMSPGVAGISPGAGADERMTFEFQIFATTVSTKKQNELVLDPSTVKFSLIVRNVRLRAKGKGVESSLAIRFAVDVKAGLASMKALTNNNAAAAAMANADDTDADMDLWASDTEQWGSDNRIETSANETSIMLNQDADKSKVALTWATVATVVGCNAPDDSVQIAVTTYRSSFDWSAEPIEVAQRQLPSFSATRMPAEIETAIFFVSMDLSGCSRNVTSITIDPNLSVVTEGDEQSDLTPEELEKNESSMTTAIIIGAVVIGVVLLTILIVVALNHRRNAAKHKAQQGLA